MSTLRNLHDADECVHSMLQDVGRPLQTLLQRKVKFN